IKEAGLSIPIVDELAADIFMGTFTDKFLRSSQIAAHLLTGTLYERYFGVAWKRVLELNDLQTAYGASVSPGFAALCRQLARVDESESRSVSRNGKIIEQSQILTTHNLAALIVSLKLQPTLVPRLRELAEGCFRWICGWRITPSWKANQRMAKN